jgi:peptide chain release factor 2
LKLSEVFFDIPGKDLRFEEIEKLAAAPDFWNNQEQAQALMRERSNLEEERNTFYKADSRLEDAEILHELAAEENDESSINEVSASLEEICQQVEAIEFRRMLSGPNDEAGAIVSINAGAGGTEAQDWVNMLLRMYIHWSERQGYKAEIVDYINGDQAGFKWVTFTVEGRYAYGYLRPEVGVHRLVRISPFDSNARRHTSFAALSIIADVEDTFEVEIEESDLRVDTFRSQGAGGQHVNKTDSAVRITHLPTGIVVQCQNERSQHKNRATSLKLLKARLYEVEMDKKREEQQQNYEKQKDIEWGNQIRSYVLAPYRMVKDLRTGHETGNVDAVLDGAIEDFILAYLKQFGSDRL